MQNEKAQSGIIMRLAKTFKCEAADSCYTIISASLKFGNAVPNIFDSRIGFNIGIKFIINTDVEIKKS